MKKLKLNEIKDNKNEMVNYTKNLKLLEKLKKS